MLTPYDPGPRSVVTVDEVQHELPVRLLAALERRWYADFDAGRAAIAPHLGGDVRPETRFIQIHEVVHGPDVGQELHLHHMRNVISSLRDGTHSLAYAVCSDGREVKLLLGVRLFSREPNYLPTSEYVDVLCRTLRSNHPGIVLSPEPVPFEDYRRDLLVPIEGNEYLAGITGIPSLKSQDNLISFSAQSIDRLVDALRGETYTLLILAEPITDSHLAEMISRLRRLSEEIHTLVRRSISETRARSTGEIRSTTEGSTVSVGLGGLVATLFGISAGRSWARGLSQQHVDSMGASITQETLNKTAQFCEQALEHFLVRLQRGRNLGFWNVGVYLASDDRNTYLRAQGIARGLYSGQQTHHEPMRVLDLCRSPYEVREALGLLRNPSLAGDDLLHPLGPEFHSLGTPLTTEEVSLLVSLPRREVPGLRLRSVADFNLNPPAIHGFELGHLLYRGEKLSARVAVSSESLTRHTFVTGLTGSGKTNTCLALLADAYRNRRLKFLVIDPAKTEYRFLLYASELGEDLLIFTLGDEQMAPFRLNPFEFAPGFPLLTHIDLIKAVFNAAFPMYASMPYLLEEALVAIYQAYGWDIATSTNRFVDVNDLEVDYTAYLPRLSDLYGKVDEVVASKRYGAQLTQDISAALKARLGSLLHGGKGLMLDTQHSIPLEELLDRPVVLELRRGGDPDERAFIMALLFILLYEVCQTRPPDGQLRHVTLFEEAHRLLRNVPMTTSVEVASPRGKAVEMFTDMMAEMRAYGEGFIIVDQMPGKLVPDVIKGSNLKIIHRLMAQDDRDAVGNAMGLNESQVEHLPRLTVGQAVIHSEELGEACLAKIDLVEDELAAQQPGNTPQERELATRGRLKKQMDHFYARNREVFRRHPVCALCDAPCDYRSPWTQPDDTARKAFDRLFGAFLYSEAQDCLQVWREIRTRLRRRLVAVHNPSQWSEGVLLCHLAQLSRVTIAGWCDYYSQAGARLGVGVGLQAQTAEVLQALLTEASDRVFEDRVELLRKTMWEELAYDPPNTQPGCALCRRPCRFGYLVQRLAPLRPDSLAVRIQGANRASPFDRDYDRLVRLMSNVAAQTAGIPFADRELPHLGYCYLARSTTRDHVLTGYQRVNRE